AARERDRITERDVDDADAGSLRRSVVDVYALHFRRRLNDSVHLARGEVAVAGARTTEHRAGRTHDGIIVDQVDLESAGADAAGAMHFVHGRIARGVNM